MSARPGSHLQARASIGINEHTLELHGYPGAGRLAEWVCDDWRMFGDDANREGFEEFLRSIVREVSESVEGMAGELDEIAGAIGVDPVRAREFVDGATRFLRSQFGGLGEEVAFGDRWQASPAAFADSVRGAGPHPLDLPTDEQGVALAALESGRWTVEPGSNALVAGGDGSVPSQALGLVGELRARDWIAADGAVTLVGRHALRRWLSAAGPE